MGEAFDTAAIWAATASMAVLGATGHPVLGLMAAAAVGGGWAWRVVSQRQDERRREGNATSAAEMTQRLAGLERQVRAGNNALLELGDQAARDRVAARPARRPRPRRPAG
jgi:hypothetical protein